MVTGIEAAAVVRAGASVVQAVRSRNKPQNSAWPEARDAPMELFVVDDEW